MTTRQLRPMMLIPAFAILATAAAGSAPGQDPHLKYQVPSRGPLSPYLDLLRVDAGILPPYHTFVQPRRTVHDQLSQQRQSIDVLQSELSARPSHSPGLGSDRPTGGGGRFQTYLHYYNFGAQRH